MQPVNKFLQGILTDDGGRFFRVLERCGDVRFHSDADSRLRTKSRDNRFNRHVIYRDHLLTTHPQIPEWFAEALIESVRYFHHLMIGTKLAHYEITSHLGTGGMGEVYQATDSKLGRSVAIKVLPAAFTRDVERIARFEREARALASLNHPNIAAIYGVEESGDRKFLVMELVPGETLAERIKSGPIPLDETLGIAKQIVDALEEAHEKGIIHRDLKPANVKIKPDGTVKVLDFGLAKMGGTQTAGPVDESPTITGNTQAGVILGTASYMAPEQAMGKPVDKRVDIYAFGAVVYEMVTGKRLHSGSNITEVLASVIKDEPRWVEVPPRLKKLLRRCLEKDPQQRLHHIGDVMELLEEEAPATATVLPAVAGMSRRWLWPGIAALLALVAAVGWWAPWRGAEKVEALRFPIPETDKFKLTEGATPSVSPNGKWVVFPAAGTDGLPRLWLRALDTVEVRPLEGTESANGLPPPAYWSPDSRFIVYGATPGVTAPGKLMRQDISGGPPQAVCNVSGSVGGVAWSRDGTLVFADNGKRSLQRVIAAGGEPVTAVELPPTETRHMFPQFLPDGRRFLYFRATGSNETMGIYIGSLDAAAAEQSKKPVLLTNRQAYYSPTGGGYLVFLRDRTLFAQAFDADTATLSGDPSPIADQVASFAPAFAAQFSLSENGVLAYNAGPATNTSQLWILDRSGKRSRPVGDPGFQGNPEISPDGNRIATTRTDLNNASSNIWVTDLTSGRSTKVTYGNGRNDYAVWSPNGENLMFSSNRNGVMDLYLKKADGSGEERLILKTPEDKWATSWSKNGHLLFQSVNAQTGTDIWVLPQPESGKSEPVSYLKTKFEEGLGRFSPDGRWVAHVSRESGPQEVYVRPFDPQRVTESADAGRSVISRNGGSNPRWRAAGKKLFLFYLSSEQRISSIAVDGTKPYVTQGDIQVHTNPRPVIGYDVSADGSSFVSQDFGSNDGSKGQLTVVTNWQAVLKN